MVLTVLSKTLAHDLHPDLYFWKRKFDCEIPVIFLRPVLRALRAWHARFDGGSVSLRESGFSRSPSPLCRPEEVEYPMGPPSAPEDTGHFVVSRTRGDAQKLCFGPQCLWHYGDKPGLRSAPRKRRLF